jgi:TRAP-type C4-dicarboxylate transport system permease small subunit
MQSRVNSIVVRYTKFALVAFLSVPHHLYADPQQVNLENPLVTDSIQEFLLAVLRIFVIVAVPIVIFFIIYAGFKFVTAQGNAEALQTAKRALLYALLGGLIVLGAFAIVAMVTDLVSVFTGNDSQ